MRLFLRERTGCFVDEQHIDCAEAIAEAGHAVFAQRADHLVGELFRGDVADVGDGLTALYLVSDGMHQMCLAHADAAVEKQRIVGLGRTLCDSQRGRAGELIAVADDEVVEGVARVELRSCGPVEAALLLGRIGRATVGLSRKMRRIAVAGEVAVAVGLREQSRHA